MRDRKVNANYSGEEIVPMNVTFVLCAHIVQTSFFIMEVNSGINVIHIQ